MSFFCFFFERFPFPGVCYIGMFLKKHLFHPALNSSQMKKALLVSSFTLFFFSMVLQAQKPEEIISPIRIEYDSLYYARQAQVWKEEIQKNNQNEEAWENYYKASKYQLTWYRNSSPDGWEKLNTIVKEMGDAVPNSFFYTVLQYERNISLEKEPDMRRAMAMRPDDLKYFPEYVAFLMHSGSEEELRKYCRKWYESGVYSANLLSYGYNELASTEPGAILFTNGDAVVYSKYLLQYGKEIFTDRKTICLSFLSLPYYVEKLIKELNLPDFMEEYRNTPPQEQAAAFVKHVVRHSKRPVYVSMVAGGTALKDSLYSEGVVMKYADAPYDNLAVTKHNFENVYLKDYLKVSFVPETYKMSAQQLNLSYVHCLHSLLRFYKDSGDQAHFRELYQLMRTIVEQSEAETTSKEYAEKILQEFSK